MQRKEDYDSGTRSNGIALWHSFRCSSVLNPIAKWWRRITPCNAGDSLEADSTCQNEWKSLDKHEKKDSIPGEEISVRSVAKTTLSTPTVYYISTKLPTTTYIYTIHDQLQS